MNEDEAAGGSNQLRMEYVTVTEITERSRPYARASYGLFIAYVSGVGRCSAVVGGIGRVKIHSDGERRSHCCPSIFLLTCLLRHGIYTQCYIKYILKYVF